jgi:amino acid adenylation domain-containing protein
VTRRHVPAGDRPSRLEHALEAAARAAPDKVALVVDDLRLTYAELDEKANRFAHALRRAGLRRGDRVALFLDNSVELVVGMFGVAKAGGVYSIVNTLTKAPKLTFILDDLAPRIVVSHERLLHVLEETLPKAASVEQVFLSDVPGAQGRYRSLWDELEREPGTPPPNDGIDLDLAYVIYTSGSTGSPKGVMMTHQSSVQGASSVIRYLGACEDDVVLSVVPMSFDYGMYQVIMSCLVGSTLVLEHGFAFPHEVMRKIAAEKVTALPLVPTTAAIIVNLKGVVAGAYPTLRYVTSTSAPLPPAHGRRLQELFPSARIFSNYGLTENIRGTYLPPEELARIPTSVGKAMPNSEAYVVDDVGRPLPHGSVGELVFRGANLMRGYWRNPEATDAALRPGPYPWEKVLHTGDLFRADEDGFLYYVGRKDDLLKSRGEKVPPKEVEDVLYALPGVREAAIVGIPDEVQGMAIRAIVALAPEYDLSARDLQAHCARFLEDYMVPSSVEFRAELPKTESGKVKRRELQAAALKPAGAA